MTSGQRKPDLHALRSVVSDEAQTLDAVHSELGVDYRTSGGELLFERELVQQRLGPWAWLLGFWGIGTYKRNDEVDIRYEVEGQPRVAHALDVIPPS